MFDAMPLPCGRYVVAAIQVIHPLTLTFYTGPGLNGQAGHASWRGQSLPATLFWNARDAENCAKALNAHKGA
jgi:hypothetical protein